MTYLVTGTAGFIGMNTAKRLLERGERVVGIDSVNDYYEVALKRERLAELTGFAGFRFLEGDLADPGVLAGLVADEKPTRMIHLAAQPGVRYSLENPHAYIQSNIVGHLNVIEAVRHSDTIEHLAYASSSSVYGANETQPFSESDRVDSPVSLYAATKRADELMSRTYSHLYGMSQVGLRFFTVYGPWGRPDMAPWLFTKAILAGEPIKVFNNGEMKRDFTYIDDIVEGVIRTLDKVAAPNPDWNSDNPGSATSAAPYRVYNIGNSEPVNLMHYIEVLEECLGKKAEMNLLPLQPGDVPDTYADVTDLVDAVGYKPATTVEEGVSTFVDWYRQYYSV